MLQAHSKLRFSRGILSGFLRVSITLLPVILAGVLVMPTRAQDFVFSSGGGSLSLTISSATAGSEPDDETDNSTELFWDADFGITSKMTVSTLCATQAFKLFVDFSVTTFGSGTAGTEQGEIELFDGMLDTDIFRDIPSTLPGRTGNATLTYRVSATVADGNSLENGDDFHTVTYTLLAQ